VVLYAALRACCDTRQMLSQRLLYVIAVSGNPIPCKSAFPFRMTASQKLQADTLPFAADRER
jgi:hypothetical protein